MPTATIDWLMAATLGSSILVAAILIGRRPLRSALGARAAYALWLAVPVQLLVGLPGFDWGSPVRLVLPSLTTTLADGGAPALPAAAGVAEWIAAAWMAGTVLLLSHLVARTVQSSRLAASGTPWLPTAGLEPPRLEDLRIRLSGEVRSPVVVGFWRPLILLPTDIERRIDGPSLALVLGHEACHARRRDNLVNLMACGLVAVFWFNPLAWLAYRAFRVDQELSCDAHVLGGAGRARRARYGRALLDLAAPAGTGPGTTSWHLHHSTKRRIMMLKQHRISRLRAMAGTTLACAFVALAIAIAPGTDATTQTDASRNPDAGQPVVRVNPVYPAKAAEAGTEGSVQMAFTITEEGNVTDIEVLDAAPGDVFVDSAVQALSKWRFVPDAGGGKLPRRAVQTIEFRLDRESAE